MITVEVAGAEFTWGTEEEVGDCMNRARVVLDEGMGRIEGELCICLHEEDDGADHDIYSLEWILFVNGKKLARDEYEEERFLEHNARLYIKEAMKQSAFLLRGILREKQAKTQAVMAKQARQKERAAKIDGILRRMSEEGDTSARGGD